MFDKDIVALKCSHVQESFLQRIYQGDTLENALSLLKINPAALAMVRKSDQLFDSAIRDAQSFRVEMMVDRLEHLDDDFDDARMVTAISNNIKWLATKRNREQYGDKVDVQHNVTINIRAAMEDARSRVTLEHAPNTMIDITNATDSTSVALPVSAMADEEIDPLS